VTKKCDQMFLQQNRGVIESEAEGLKLFLFGWGYRGLPKPPFGVKGRSPCGGPGGEAPEKI